MSISCFHAMVVGFVVLDFRVVLWVCILRCVFEAVIVVVCSWLCIVCCVFVVV